MYFIVVYIAPWWRPNVNAQLYLRGIPGDVFFGIFFGSTGPPKMIQNASTTQGVSQSANATRFVVY